MGTVLESSAVARLRRCRHDWTLDLYTRRGAFWVAVNALRWSRGITACREVPPPPLRLPMPSTVPESAVPPTAEDEDDPALPPPSAELARWLGDLNDLHDSVVRDACRFPGGLTASRARWRAFLAACVLYDPPDTELLAFADHSPPEPEPVLPPDVLWWEGAPRAVAPAIVNLRDPDQVGADWRWLLERLVNELADRLASRGIDLRAMAAEVLATTGLWDEFRDRQRDNPPEPYIDVDPDTSAQDVRDAHATVVRGYGVEHAGGRSHRDPLTAVQCAVLKRLGWTERAIAVRLGWALQEDDYGVPRRSGRVRGHVQEGENILVARGIPPGFQPST